MPWGPKPRSVSVGVRLGGAGAHKKIETGAPVGVRAHSSPQPSAMARDRLVRAVRSQREPKHAHPLCRE